MGPHYLNHLFDPKSIAVLGASEREHSRGSIIFRNLLACGFKGKLYPVNPNHSTVQNHRAYKSINDIQQPVDLAIIISPAATVPDIIRQCGVEGVNAAIILSDGLGETAAGNTGAKLQAEMMKYAHQYGVRILGPNCLGLMLPKKGLNATFTQQMANPGHMALVSQSGALCTAAIDWARAEGLGYSAVISLGDVADIGFGEILDYLAMDPSTHSILLYIEAIRDARSFISGLRIAARIKPVVVVKAGRFQQGLQTAIHHTGAVIGSDDVFHAALRRAGAVRAYTIQQMVNAAEILSRRHYHVKGDQLAIITNGRGPAIMACDRAVELEVPLFELEQTDLDQLNPHLLANWSHANPLDLLGDATAEHYQVALNHCLQAGKVAGVLVLLSPQTMTDATAVARLVIETSQNSPKPVIACWMGSAQVAEANRLFRQHNLPHFDTPEFCVGAFALLTSYQRNQQLLMQVPGPFTQHRNPDIAGARLIVEEALASGRQHLSSLESRAVVRAFHLPLAPAIYASNANDALIAAETLGFPLAMKINAPDIQHRSDVGGVRLNISSAATVRHNFHEMLATVREQYPDAEIQGVTLEPMYRRAHGRELMIGVVRDPVFGPAISIGAGGVIAEVMQDPFTSLPPLNQFLAQHMISRTRVNKLLRAFRGMPAIDFNALEEVLLRVSELVCEIPEIRKIDINPLIADDQGALVVDVKIQVDAQPATTRPYAHMAVHPYPAALESNAELADGTTLLIRPIRPEDASLEQDFIRRLSPQSIYFRFMQTLNKLTPEMLMRFTQIDYDLEMAFVAMVIHQQQETVVGVARYMTNPDGTSCEFALVVADDWHHKGIGSRLMLELIKVARQRGLTEMEGEILTENQGMLALMKKLGFTIRIQPDDLQLRRAVLRLTQS
ncbi:bifunctional acetate--CoA ligase family protein/GNAT family N-acetyltransferase [Aestuariicella hydrocarbonica]|uniref:Bifunctional acetate--CoA ligase family protein/GNAT family N-acetyltransferase n=1 Tax=Pseudomaricurvus hydrocarbonicus TaxID=1470433 RepID=A0A9E5JUS8_9GAMM|nr:bifunctional acetate--CoA ligase family protein/GNAT family N-acetyltransferase [Aestuariicella hydrocarbonica]NHO65851.1 bifunctional acetate--CoA ligase family protein/GNAT family N-acetyltransferase [Aestuariicella hydrocarbonica]